MVTWPWTNNVKNCNVSPWHNSQSFLHSFFYGSNSTGIGAVFQRLGLELRLGLLWPPYVIGGALYFCPVVSFYLSSIFLSFFFFLASSQQPQIGCLPYFYTWRGPSANLECRSEMCCSQLAANAQPKKVAKNRHLGTIPQLCPAITLSGYIFATKACSDNRKKNLLSSNISPTCPHNMVNFGPLAAEILSLVWGTPANFNGFRVLAALLHGTLVVSVSQTAALNRGRHLYSAGQPSRWALAHISS